MHTLADLVMRGDVVDLAPHTVYHNSPDPRPVGHTEPEAVVDGIDDHWPATVTLYWHKGTATGATVYDRDDTLNLRRCAR